MSTLAFPSIAGAQYGFIINTANPTANLSLAQLKHVLRGDQQFWSDGKRIVIALPSQNLKERSLLLKDIYNMSESDLQTYWLTRVFRGEVTASPITLSSEEAIAELVGKNDGSIGFIDLGQIKPPQQAGFKVLSIDDKKPTDSGYLFPAH